MPRIPPHDQVPFPTDGASGSQTMITLFRTLAHRPEIMRHTQALLEATMRGGNVEPQLKELLAIRVSQVNHCFY
jgi:alkylhydroperoxidase family enzyme